jgi:transcriptional regulator with GAF, ATPase, and Fis domain
MNTEDKIALSAITVVNQAIAESDELETMCTHLAQLLVAALGIKGCVIFILNPESQELEILSSFGLSISYLNKGPVLTNKSIANSIKGKPVIVQDINTSDKLQYPENAKAEGIGAIVSMPIKFRGSVIGALRLYHYKAWNLSERDITFLQCLSDHLGLAMTYTRLSNALQVVKEAVTGIHPLWF